MIYRTTWSISFVSKEKKENKLNFFSNSIFLSIPLFFGSQIQMKSFGLNEGNFKKKKFEFFFDQFVF